LAQNILKNFIVIEGIDGAGTTTQAKLLAQNIKNGLFTYEPSNSPIGLFIRDILKGKVIVNENSLPYLFSADRAEHLFGQNGIIQNIENGKIVISDRYFFSSIAYQSLSFPKEKIISLNESFPLPKIVFFINTPVEESMKRIGIRKERDIFDKEELQKKILNNYIEIFDYYKDKTNVVTIDGLDSIDNILNKLSVISCQLL